MKLYWRKNIMYQWLFLLFDFGYVVTESLKNLPSTHCEVEPPSRGILDLKHALHPAQLINVTSSESLQGCSGLCCKALRCNAYIWRNSEQCFLFHCKPKEKCKVVPYQGTVTGFVSKEQIPEGNISNATERISNERPTDKQNTSTTETEFRHQSNKNADSKVKIQSVSIKKSQLDVQPSVIDKKEAPEPQYNSKGIKPGKNNTESTEVKEKKSATKLKKSKGKTMKKSHSEKSVPVLKSSAASQKVSHTTTTSLISALVFGIVFLVAVAIQIGKPWWESLFTHRDGYNRITFLMNGK